MEMDQPLKHINQHVKKTQVSNKHKLVKQNHICLEKNIKF